MAMAAGNLQHAGHGDALERRAAFFQRGGGAVHQGVGDIGMITGFDDQNVHIKLRPFAWLPRLLTPFGAQRR